MSKNTVYNRRKQRGWRVAILIPTYNEVTNIQTLLEEIANVTKSIQRGIEITVFVLDDNSADGTAKLAKQQGKKLARPNFSVQVIDRPKKAGLGMAYIDGIKIALKGGYDAIQQMDADLSHNPQYLPRFIELGKSHDMVVGSRYIKGGGTPDWPLFRRLLSKGGNFYNRLFLGSQIHDYTGGFNQFKANILRTVNLNQLHSGYCFFLELKWSINQKTTNVCEIPIIFMDRQYGSSKIPKKTIAQNIILTQQLWLKKIINA